MISVEYFGILIKKNNHILYESTNPSAYKKYGKINYLEMLSELELNFNSESEENVEEHQADTDNINDSILDKKSGGNQENIQLKTTEKDNVWKIPDIIEYKRPYEDSVDVLLYNIALKENLVLICVTSEEYKQLRQLMEQLLDKIELYYLNNIIKANEMDEGFDYNKFAEYIKDEISIIFANNMLSELYVPSIQFQDTDNSSSNGSNGSSSSSSGNGSSKADNVKKELKNQSNEENLDIENELIQIKNQHLKKIDATIQEFNDFFRANSNIEIDLSGISSISRNIDGISNIQSISEKINIKISTMIIYIFRLVIDELVQIRFPIYDWYVFERTHRANKYLFDGSEEQISLINKFNGGKIISLLSRFDGKSALSDIVKKMKITELDVERFIHELSERSLIKIIKNYPKIEKIEDEILPLLVIQGLSQDDVDLLDELKSQFDGKRTIIDVALNIRKDPKKIKSILNKIKDYVSNSTI